jgi:hypothetical protein
MSLAKRKGWLRASGGHREVGPERSVEQSRGPMDKNRTMRPTRPDERAKDREVHGHQGPGLVNPAGMRGRRSILPSGGLRCVPESRLRSS